MTIQELLEKYESILSDCEKKALPGFVGLEVVVADLRQVLNDLRPKVSKEIVEWYEESGNTKIKFLTDTSTFNDLTWKLPDGMTIQKAVNIFQFGYEVEKEKLYTVISKVTGDCLLWDAEADRYEFCDIEYDNFEKAFTKGHLQSIDIWENTAFEIKEVEE